TPPFGSADPLGDPWTPRQGSPSSPYIYGGFRADLTQLCHGSPTTYLHGFTSRSHFCGALAEPDEFAYMMSEEYHMSMMGELKFFLDLQIPPFLWPWTQKSSSITSTSVLDLEDSSFSSFRTAESNEEQQDTTTGPRRKSAPKNPHAPKIKEQVRYSDQRREEIDKLVESLAPFSSSPPGATPKSSPPDDVKPPRRRPRIHDASEASPRRRCSALLWRVAYPPRLPRQPEVPPHLRPNQQAPAIQPARGQDPARPRALPPAPSPHPGEAASSSQRRRQSRSLPRLAFAAPLRAVEEFFSGRGSSDEDGEDEGSEPEDGGDAATGFFLGLFKRDAALRSTTSGATRRASTSCTTPATPSTAGGCWRTARSSPSSAACSAGTSNGCPASSSIPAARSARPSSSGCKIASPTSEFYLPCDDKQRKILMD
ncbi:hypothetical protein ZWY2020_039616, partial [Hordeum vulgare]